MLGVLNKLFSLESHKPKPCIDAEGRESDRLVREQEHSQSKDGGGYSASALSASSQWLSHYAKVAPEEISRWVNPEDGSGNISYGQLVKNLNLFNIPVLPMKTFANLDTSACSMREIEDRCRTVTGFPRECMSGAVLLDAPPTQETQGVEQNNLNISAKKTPQVEQSRSGKGERMSEVSCKGSALEVGGVRETPADARKKSKSHSLHSSQIRNHNGATLDGSPARYNRADFLDRASKEDLSDTADGASQPRHIEQTLRVPVTAVHATYIGPVRETRGPLSGVATWGATRPGLNSQVPPDYIKVLNSEVRVFYDGEKSILAAPDTLPIVRPNPTDSGALARGNDSVSCDVVWPHTNAAPKYSPVANASRSNEGNGDGRVTGRNCRTVSARVLHKPPPIFLAPLIERKAEKRRLEGCVTQVSGTIEGGEDKTMKSPSARNEGVIFSLGRYVWTPEDALEGTAGKGEPEMDRKMKGACIGAVFPAVLKSQHQRRSSNEVEMTNAENKEQDGSPQSRLFDAEDIGVPAVVERCRKNRAELQRLSGMIDDFVREDVCAGEGEGKLGIIMKTNRGGRGGLCAVRHAKKGSVVFVEPPMLKAEMTPEKLWEAFQSLTEDQKTHLAKLDGCAADLSNVESLLCALHCRTLKARGCLSNFQNFFGKLKLNVYALRYGEGWALYPYAARIKHSCQPNVTYRNIDGLLVFFALNDIPEGSPITMSYIDQLYMPTQERRKRLVACKRIFCECSRCLDSTQPERKILCPACRPTKLCFVEEASSDESFARSDDKLVEEERYTNSLQNENVTCLAVNEQVCVAERSEPRIDKHMLAPDKTAEQAPAKQPEEAEGQDDASASDHGDSSCPGSTYDGDSEDLTNFLSDASSVSVCTLAQGEDRDINMVDRLCIVSTSIAAKERNADYKETTGDVEHRIGEPALWYSNESSLQQRDLMCQVEREEFSERCETTPPPASPLGGLCTLHWKNAAPDTEEKGSRCNGALRTSSLDGFTSAESSDKCSENGFPEVEEEQSIKRVVFEKSVAAERPSSPQEKARSSSGTGVRQGNTLETKYAAYCLFEGEGCWTCGSCKKTFADNDMPLALEAYLTGYYTALRGRIGRPTPEAWNTECGQLVRTVEKVLGVEHWLYVAGHLILAQFYLGMWMGGLVMDDILTHALRHAALVSSSSSEPAFSAGKHIDVSPLVTAVLRILLFNARCRDFVEWIEKRDALQVIRDTLGTYDEVYVSLSTAYLYVRDKLDGGSSPSIGALHRFAHASQRSTALEAAFYEKREAEEEERIARIRAAKTEEDRMVARLQTLRKRQIQKVQRNIAALKSTSGAEKRKQAQDVTFTCPDSVVGRYLRKYAAPGATVGTTDAALRDELQGTNGNSSPEQGLSDATVTANTAYEQAKRFQQLAIEGQYPSGLPLPQNRYLPLIMLANPLQATAIQRDSACESVSGVQTEKKHRVDAEDVLRRSAPKSIPTAVGCDEHEQGHDGPRAAPTEPPAATERKNFIYRIPGLPGTAPGEFVTISQINHTKDGSFPPIPFFRTFFYVDHEARQLANNIPDSEEPSVDIRVLGCSATGTKTLAEGELEDLAAARCNYLHSEGERLNREARTTLALKMGRRAEEAAATLRSVTRLGKRQVASIDGIDSEAPIDILQELNSAVCSVLTRDAQALRRVERFRQSTIQENHEGETTISVHNVEGNRAEGRNDVTVHCVLDCQELSSKEEEVSIRRPPEAVPERQSGTLWEAKVVPAAEVQSMQNALNMRKSTEQLAAEDTADKTAAEKQPKKHDLQALWCARRFIKPLDFSHVPPPPILPACDASFLGAQLSQYELARAVGRSACRRPQCLSADLPPRSVVTTLQNSALTTLFLFPLNSSKSPNRE